MSYVPWSWSEGASVTGIGYTFTDFYSALWEIVSDETAGHMRPAIGTTYTAYGIVFTVTGIEPGQFVILQDPDGTSVEIPGFRWSPNQV